MLFMVLAFFGNFIITRGDQKVLQFSMMYKWQIQKQLHYFTMYPPCTSSASKMTTYIVSSGALNSTHSPLNINTLFTFFKKFFYSSQIEFLEHVLQLIIIEKPRSAKVLLQKSK